MSVFRGHAAADANVDDDDDDQTSRESSPLGMVPHQVTLASPHTSSNQFNPGKSSLEHGTGENLWWKSNFKQVCFLRKVAIISEDLIVIGS